MFQLHFMTKHSGSDFRVLDFKCQEDWKAAIYAWGGPKPSHISRVELEFDKETLEFNIYFLEKRFEQSLPQGGESGEEKEALDSDTRGQETHG